MYIGMYMCVFLLFFMVYLLIKTGSEYILKIYCEFKYVECKISIPILGTQLIYQKVIGT